MKETAIQEGGSHYDSHDVQPIDLIRSHKLDFEEGSIIKYVVRYKSKNGLEDLKKAQQYLGWLIRRYEVPKPRQPIDDPGTISVDEKALLKVLLGKLPKSK